MKLPLKVAELLLFVAITALKASGRA